MKRLYTLTEKRRWQQNNLQFDIQNFEAGPADPCWGYNKLLINRKPSKVDDGDNNLYFNDRDAKGNAFLLRRSDALTLA